MQSPLTHSIPPERPTRPVVLCIGGSDSAGLAGIQMDLRCLEALGVHGATAITATTAQNNAGLFATGEVDGALLEAQIDAALALAPAAIKIGLLCGAAQVELLARKLAASNVPVVLDTVLATSSGGAIGDNDMRQALLAQLLPLATVVTPNLEEAAQLLDLPVATTRERHDAAAALRGRGADWAVLKGGHDEGETATDRILGNGHHFTLSQPRLDTAHTRGTGCALAAGIAGAIALGYEVRDAIVIARMLLQDALDRGRGAGSGIGCPLPTGFPESHWPAYADETLAAPESPFPGCTGGSAPITLGLYPVVDSADWLARLLPLGVSTAQLRVKHLSGNALSQEIRRAVAIGREHDCRLFINDYWQLAIEHGAYGVHLGQEDLDTADLQAIHAAGLRLGLSNHCHYELVRALAARPSYIAVGPVHATTTKDMPWIPHGLAGLRYWTRTLAGYPLVAIAGIKPDNIEAIAATGVSGIAMITAITGAPDPEGATRALMQAIEDAREAAGV